MDVQKEGAGGEGEISVPTKKMKEKPKKLSGIESIEGSIEKPRYRPGGIAKIKKEHHEKKKKKATQTLLGDHIDVEVSNVQCRIVTLELICRRSVSPSVHSLFVDVRK